MRQTVPRRLLLSFVVLVAVAGATAVSVPTAVAADDHDSIERHTLEVTKYYDVNGEANETLHGYLEIENPEVLDDDGVEYVELTVDEPVANPGPFDETDDGTYVLDEAVDDATLAYLEEDVYPTPSGRFVRDGGTWAAIKPSRIGLSTVNVETDFYTSVSIERSLVAPEEGFYSDEHNTYFVGAHENHTATVDGESVTIVAPEDVDTDAQHLEAARDSLLEVAEVHDVDDGHDHYVGLALTNGRAAASSIDPRFWVPHDRAVNEVGSTWVHEFAHATDDWSDEDDLDWLTEAYATWYDTLYPLELEHSEYDSAVFSGTDFADFQERRSNGYDYDYDLSDDEAWNGTQADYYQGGLVVGAIDREIRLATEGERTFEDVARELNALDGRASHDDLLSILVDVSGSSAVAVQANEWIGGESHPELWDPHEHEEAFGYGVPLIEAEHVDAVVETGDGESDLVAGEPNVVRAGDEVNAGIDVANAGSGDGRVPAHLSLGLDVVDDVDGTVAAGTEETAVLTYEAASGVDSNLQVYADGERTTYPIVVADEDAAVLDERDETSASDPLSVEPDQEIFLVSTERGSTVTFEQDAGDDVETVSMRPSNHRETLDADALVAGETYEVTFESEDGDVLATQSVTVEAENEPPEVEIDGVPEEISVAGDFRATAEVTASDGEIESYEWDMGDGTTDDHFYTTHSYDETGEFEIELTVVDEHGLAATATRSISVYEPEAYVALDAPDEVEAGETFDAEVAGVLTHGDVERYEWDFGDGTTAEGSDESIAYSYDGAGEYEVSLTVVDEYGATATDTSTVHVDAEEEEATDEVTRPDDALLVDDFEDADAWADNRNDLGAWTGGGNFESLAVQDGALTIEYDDGGWFVTNVDRDVDEFDELAFVVRGAEGGEGQHLELEVGATRATLAGLSGDAVGTEYDVITVDLADVDADGELGEVRVEAPWGADPSTVEIDEIWLQ